MKRLRFYREPSDKVLAVDTLHTWIVEGIKTFEAVGYDSGYVGRVITDEWYLGKYCQEVSRKDARALYPALFEWPTI